MKDKLDRATRRMLDEVFGTYEIRKTKDHYMLELNGRIVGVVGGNDRKVDKAYMARKASWLVAQARRLGVWE